ncbi:MAG TPA: phosphoribosylformylglycinamidine synthase subunit PurQ [Alphaproteobacteria bacterium]|jgi:phosphoribosylformylglycinamidine synthase|nr:phosphoribosylformylglycinamidine synthase subunit PurQ [Alphaproteobacteria bacterium]
MQSAIIVFPGSNRERDAAAALKRATGKEPLHIWHRESDFPAVDFILLPGGFSYGDYLRCGAMAAQSPIMREVKARAAKGVPILGICNGFQILVETGLLPGALLRNASLKFICKRVRLSVEKTDTIYTNQYAKGDIITVPVAHGDGNYVADAETLKRVEGEGQVAFRYVDMINGSMNNIAGITDSTGRILGLMPHPEDATDPAHGGTDGIKMFAGIAEAMAA